MDERRPADRLRVRLRGDLTAAMRARRSEELATIRSLMAAIDNAEAPGVGSPASPTAPSSADFAGAVAGLGSGDASRRELNEADLGELLDAEITDRREQADVFESLGRPDEALRLRDQVVVIERYRDKQSH
jgi:uncharacterized protein YqeY